MLGVVEMKEASELPSGLLEFFQLAPRNGTTEADQMLEAQRIVGALETHTGGWDNITDPLIDWLKQRARIVGAGLQSRPRQARTEKPAADGRRKPGACTQRTCE